MNPQMLAQLLGAAGGQPGGQMGPESLLSILASLFLGGQPGAGAANAGQLGQGSLGTLLPQLLQRIGSGGTPPGGALGGAPWGAPGGGNTMAPVMNILSRLGMTRPQ